ncbi:hypothetical protein SASPL_144615 [Salvia splendens]|uniref:Sulfite exporter TauE/SafE n=1 Tax=Salvia splendens TaxID=180675 RepID=A0A8X8WGQ0_SALSN|nr:hypothetical protein SASPL_144615 [Salvia splendens]
MKHTFLKCLFLLTILSSTSCKSGVETSNTVDGIGIRSAAVAALSSLAAAISSAGGVGGGGLFIPILTIVGGQDVKTASAYSAFMVTGGAVANVAAYTLWRSGGARRLIDYEMALLCQPWLLLGVSCGVVLNVVFPEWLIMLIFVVFVAGCTFKTCRSGAACWRLESREFRGETENGGESTKMPLLCATADQVEDEVRTPWVSFGMLVLIWFSFFALYLLRGNRYGHVRDTF